MFGWLRKAGSRSPVQSHGAARPFVRGKYDSAQTTDENRRHWANADHLSADAAASADVRRILRARARYEVANNSFAKGMVQTLAHDVVGTGPRLQMLIPDDGQANTAIEREFAKWAKAVRLSDKLLTMRRARCESGEVFALLQLNPAVDHPVKLDIRLIEADQVATPSRVSPTWTAVDGIVFDGIGNPQRYLVLRRHPGDSGPWLTATDTYDIIPASRMIHLFWLERPGQHRGIPELTPALPLFAMLRRYRLAVLAAAETAANMSLQIYTDSPPNGEADAVDPMDVIDIERGQGMFLPAGWKPSQLKAEQPTQNHVEFIQSVMAEISRCVLQPYIVAAGDSSKSNYASGRLDRQTYNRAIRIDQAWIGEVVMDRILQSWVDQAVLVDDLLPDQLRTLDALKRHDHQWMWDGFDHVDPAKEANAQGTRLTNHTTTLAAEYARQGLDWEQQLQQRARELKLMRTLGIATGQTDPAQNSADPTSSTDDATDDATDDEEVPVGDGEDL